MELISLRGAIQSIGGPLAGKPFAISTFACYPKSLRALVRATQNPNPGSWEKVLEHEYDGLHGLSTDSVQGFATDGQYWYVSITPDDNSWAVVAKFDESLNQQLAFFHITHRLGVQHHAGDLDFFEGRIYVALECPAKVLVLDPNLETVLDYKPLSGQKPGEPPPAGGDNPWCAVNPWNRHLYSSTFGGANRCNAFDLSTYMWVPDRDIVFRGADVRGAQGGKFDGNGHLLMTSREYKDIRVFSTLNGQYFGNCEVDEKPWDELEGLCIWPRREADGTPVQVHVASVVSKESGVIFAGGKGQLYRKGYRVPDFSLMQ